MKNHILFCVMFFTLGAFGQDGTPDINFGDNGVVLTSFGESSIYVFSVSQGVSGRIAVLGTEYPVLVDTIHFIQVYNEDGTVDTSFGDNGIVKIVDNSGAPVHKINVLSDNSILFDYGGIRKLLPNGAVDTTFGTNGYINLGLSLTDTLGHVVHPDGSIYVYGNKITGDREYIIKKFDSNGVVDTSFGNQGFVFLFIDFYAVFSENNIQFLDNDNLLLNYSYQETFNSNSFNYITKIDASGTIDTSFGVNGIVESTFYGLRNSNFHMVDSGDFFISYAADDSGVFRRRVESYTSNGNLNTSFADNGILADHSVSFVQQNQRLVTRQDAPDTNNGYMPELSRVFDTGLLDNSFNFQFNYSALSTNAVAQAADGKIIIAGTTNDFPDSNLVVLRYNNTPLNVEEFEETSVAIVPNPADSKVEIICDGCQLMGKPYTIYDTTGKIINTDNFRSEKPTIDVSSFAVGLYFLKTQESSFKFLKK